MNHNPACAAMSAVAPCDCGAPLQHVMPEDRGTSPLSAAIEIANDFRLMLATIRDFDPNDKD
jgi:hypothetical protein